MKIFLACLCLFAVCTLAFPFADIESLGEDIEAGELVDQITSVFDDPAAELDVEEPSLESEGPDIDLEDTGDRHRRRSQPARNRPPVDENVRLSTN
eukprot:JP448618.1.p2 GENE.JP448618.1~~JP448618.1.p2  ORF type:complete len:96 (+),score=18.71 JP448618.1:27-314(+)